MASTLADEVASTRWYHTIELPGGVVTPGLYDLRSLVPRLPIPTSLKGKRCLDIGSNNGFWAFEMERRGADEVVAIDLEDLRQEDQQGTRLEEATRPVQLTGFQIAHRALDSKVDWRNLSVYDLSPAAVGTFDFAFIGSLLLHLRDPVGALAAARSVVRGELLSVDAVNLTLSLLLPRWPAAYLWDRDEVRWWTPNVAAHRRWLEAAGFEIVKAGGPIFQRAGSWRPRYPRSIPRSRRELHYWIVHRQFGAPTAWALCRPAGPRP